MEFLIELWLPILLSAVFVFIVSSILHMILPIHKNDCRRLPGEERLLEEIRNQGVEAGEYVFPYASSMKEVGSQEMMEKYKRGPVGYMIVKPSGGWKMGPGLAMWFVYALLISLFTAYAAYVGLGKAAEGATVFQITGAVAILAYATAYFPGSIWKGMPWANTLKFMFDGIVYGLVTGGTFVWLWPQA